MYGLIPKGCDADAKLQILPQKSFSVFQHFQWGVIMNLVERGEREGWRLFHPKFSPWLFNRELILPSVLSMFKKQGRELNALSCHCHRTEKYYIDITYYQLLDCSCELETVKCCRASERQFCVRNYTSWRPSLLYTFLHFYILAGIFIFSIIRKKNHMIALSINCSVRFVSQLSVSHQGCGKMLW